MEELLEELAEEFGSGRIHRPYRDTRFSRDKSPYRTSIGASLPVGAFVRLTAHDLGVGAGRHIMTPEELASYRAAVDDAGSGAALEEVISDLSRDGITVSARERLASSPRGYPSEHARIELLRNKDLVAWQEWPAGSWLATTEPKKRVVRFLRASMPLIAWLDAHVGTPATGG